MSSSGLVSSMLQRFIAICRLISLGLARPTHRAWSSLRLTLVHFNRGVRIRTGVGVIVSGWRHIRCDNGVTIGDQAELVAAPPRKGQTSSIILGKSVKISRRCQLASSEGSEIRIGDYSSIHNNTYVLGNIRIGRYCLISANIFMSSGDHYAFEMPDALIRDQDQQFGGLKSQRDNRVFIEDDCWLGWGSVVKKGLWIGKGSVIGANCVVTRDVPPYSVVAGQPGKVIRSRLEFSPPLLIDASDIACHPYLYRGFLLSKAERAEAVLGQVNALMSVLLTMKKVNWDWCELKGWAHVDNLELHICADNLKMTRCHVAKGDFVIRISNSSFGAQASDDEDWSPQFESWTVFSIRSDIHGKSEYDPGNAFLWSIKSFEIFDRGSLTL